MIFKNRRHIGRVSKSSARSVGLAYQLKRNRRRRFFGFFRKLAFFGFIMFCIGSIFTIGFVISIIRTLPDIEKIGTYIPAETTKIYSADGVILADLHQEENRVRIPIEKISNNLKQTVIAIEDTDFYHHHGINFKGILRAAFRNTMAGRFVEGGSTLTQQLTRNLFIQIGKKKKIRRKIAEAIMAIQIERKFTKIEILEMYLNQVYWGHNTYGIESSSQFYFGKSALDLNIAESALLVGLLKGPELYSPYKNYPLAKKRQHTVLNRMRELGLITPKTSRMCYEEKLDFHSRKKHRYKAPFFTSYVVEQLKEMYGEDEIYTSGMKIYTTLNYDLQQEAEKVAIKWVEEGNKTYWLKDRTVPSLNYTQAAILMIEAQTGYIKVMQGGVDFLETQFNRCIQADRQPGSAFKPVVYLAAMEKGFSPGSIIDDSPVTFNTIEGPYSPQNYTMKFKGPLTLRRALLLSQNVVAIKLNDLIGPKNVVDVAKRLGITSPLKPILSLPLGANEVTMLELTSAYSVLANGGIKIKPTGILKIEDRNGVVLYKHRIKEQRVFDENHVWALVEMMQGVVNYGTGRGAKLPRPMAGKTGTTTDYKDAWFIGFVPQLVTTCWVGNDDNTPMNDVTGGFIPARMWKDFMKKAIKGVERENFPTARGLVKRSINIKNGKLSSKSTPSELVFIEKFWKGKEPTDIDSGFSFSQKKDDINEDELMDFFNLQ